MANLTWIPLQDNYNAILTQEWDWQVWTIFVDRVPDFTFPVGETTFIVVNAGTTSAQLAEIDSYDAVNSTLNATNVTSLELWEWVSSTTQIHPTNSRVLISDNFQFWKAIKTAITTKINTDEDSTIEDWIKLYFWADAYITTDDDWVNLKFKDWSNPEIDLSTLAAWAWADTKFSISVADTTSWTFTDKIVDWDWIVWTINNPWAAETYTLDVDLADANTFTTTQWNADTALKTDWSGNIDTSFYSTESDAWIVTKASDAEVAAWVEDTKYITSKQVFDNYSTPFDYEWKVFFGKASDNSIFWYVAQSINLNSQSWVIQNYDIANTDYIYDYLWPDKDWSSDFAIKTSNISKVEIEFKARLQNSSQIFLLGIWTGSTSYTSEANTATKALIKFDAGENISLQTADWTTVNTTSTVSWDTNMHSYKLVLEPSSQVELFRDWVSVITTSTNIPLSSNNSGLYWGIGCSSSSWDIQITPFTVKITYS